MFTSSDINNLAEIFGKMVTDSNIDELNQTFSKFGITISKKRNTSEEIIPKKVQKIESDDPNVTYEFVPICMPIAVKHDRCLCRLGGATKQYIPSQCSGIRLDGFKVCSRHKREYLDKNVPAKFGYYDDGELPDKTPDGKAIKWKVDKMKRVVKEPEKKEIVKKTSDDGTIDLSTNCDKDAHMPKDCKQKKASCIHDELINSLKDITSSDESSDDEYDEYREYDMKNKTDLKTDLKLETKLVNGVEYTLHEDNTLTNNDHVTVGRWSGKSIEWKSDKYKEKHIDHPNYSSELV